MLIFDSPLSPNPCLLVHRPYNNSTYLYCLSTYRYDTSLTNIYSVESCHVQQRHQR